MYHFEDWFKKRLQKEALFGGNDPSSKFNSNSDSDDESSVDFAGDENTEMNLLKLISVKYPEEMMDFFHSIAQSGDQEVNSLLNKLDINKGPKLFNNPKHSFEKDEIVPSKADAGHSDSED